MYALDATLHLERVESTPSSKFGSSEDMTSRGLSFGGGFYGVPLGPPPLGQKEILIATYVKAELPAKPHSYNGKYMEERAGAARKYNTKYQSSQLKIIENVSLLYTIYHECLLSVTHCAMSP